MDPYLYREIYLQCSLALALFSFFIYSRTGESPELVEGYNKSIIWGLSIILIAFLGTRPISGAFVDMTTYAQTYEIIAARGGSPYEGDWSFSLLNVFMAKSFSVETFFLVCAALYIIPLALGANITHKSWAGAAFLCTTGAFSFFSYGVNGIRQGIATSLVILGIALGKKRLAAAVILAIASGMHKSVLIIIVAYIVTSFLKPPIFYSLVWLFCFLVSFVYGQSLSVFILGVLPTIDEARAENYLLGQGQDRGGFRIDFILYSILPVIITYILGDPKIKSEPFYRRLLSTYLLVNSFWLLSMYAAYSNRFAYLSWCLLPWLVIYPFIPNSKSDFVKARLSPAKPIMVGAVIFAHYLFTYFMFTVYYQDR